MNDIYHNAIWMKKEQDGEQKDELVWCKYPNDCLLVATGGTAGWLGWYDINRQFQYGLPFTNTTTRLWQLDGLDCVLATAYSDYNVGQAYITTDGMVWKKVKNTAHYNIFARAGRYFGNTSVCSYTETINNGTYNINVTTPVYDKDLDEWSFENKTFTITNGNGNTLMYICNTNEGAIFLEYKGTYVQQTGVTMYDLQYVRIDGNGNRTEGDHKMMDYNQPRPYRSGRGWDNCKKGNVCLHASYDRVSTGSGWRYRFVFTSTSDYGQTVTETLFKQYNDWSQYDQLNWCIFARGDYFYFVYGMYIEDRDVYIYKSTDGINWEEVLVPDWIDLEYLTDGGVGVRQTPTEKETMRIAVKPSRASNYDVELFNMMNRANGVWDVYISRTQNKTSYSVRFKDGKLVRQEEDDFYVVFGNQNGSWMAFFDNEYLASSAKACGWYGVSSNTTEGYGDTVKENDYCIRGLIKESEEV